MITEARMVMWNELILILGAYLLGSLPFMYIMGKKKGVDLREYEDGHITLWRNVGRLQGFLGVILDFTKGYTVVLASRAAGFDIGWVAFAGVAAVAGQMWPVFMKFDGEKGNSIGLAMNGALATKAMLCGWVPMIIGLAIRTIPRFKEADQSMEEKLKFGGPPSNSLPVGMAAGFAVMPLAAWGLGHQWEVIVALAAVFILILVRRATAGISADMPETSDKKQLLINRLLYDRSNL
jgi:glycerol-3-phosphate acyltransferase PlsY